MTFRYYPSYIKSYTVDGKTCHEAYIRAREAVIDSGVTYTLCESNRALEGDHVVIVSAEGGCASVINIVKRACNLISGVLLTGSGHKSYGRTSRGLTIYEFQPLSSRFPTFRVPSSMTVGQPDQYVVIEFSEWSEYSPYPQGTLIRSLGPVNSPEAEDLALRYKNMVYRKSFNPDTVRHALATCHGAIDRLNMPLTDRPVYTDTMSIDPAGSLDLDDAFSIGRDGKSISVHIADVDYFLPDGNTLEKAMRERMTSIYGHTVDPMLPKVFSAEIISLKPDKRRKLCPVITVFMPYDDDAQELRPLIASLSYIRPDAGRQLTYESAQQLLDDGDKILKAAARMTGYTDTHKIVECLMVKANFYVAKMLKNDKTILRTMDPGYTASYTFSTAGSADYHAALGLQGYTHFTSPIRRYVDLLIHRQLKDKLAGLPDTQVNADEQYLNRLNAYMQNTRRYYRDRNLLELLLKLNGDTVITTACVISYSSPYVTVSLSSYKCLFSYPLVSKKLEKIISVMDNADELQLVNTQSAVSITIPKFKEVQVVLTPMPNVTNIKGRLIMTFPEVSEFLINSEC